MSFVTLINAVTDPTKRWIKEKIVVLSAQGDMVLRGLSPGENGNDAATIAQLNKAKEAFPVGSLFLSVLPDDPKNSLGYGIWELYAKGRVLVGVDPDNINYMVPGLTGGSETHKIVVGEFPNVPAVGGSGNIKISNEVPVGDVDGINDVYTTANNFEAASPKVWVKVSGDEILIPMVPGSGFIVTGANEITLDNPLPTGSTILIDYIQA